MWISTPVALRTRRSAGRRARGELLGQPLTQVAGLAAGANLLARALEQRPRGRHGERIVHAPHQLVHRGKIAKPHADECRAAAADTLNA